MSKGLDFYELELTLLLRAQATGTSANKDQELLWINRQYFAVRK